MVAIIRKAFDGGDFLTRNLADCRLAGPHRDPVHMDSAGAAQTRATAKFRAGETRDIANRLQKHRVVGIV